MKIQPSKLFVLAISFFLILPTGCKEEKTFSLSENDLKMVDVLIDVYTVDAAIREFRDLSVKDSLKKTYFDQIYQIHDVDKEWLDAQRARLESDPVRMDSVYTRALSAVELLKAKGRPK